MPTNYYYYFCIQCIIICSHYKSVISIALVGVNIKEARYNQFPSVVSIKHIDDRNPAVELDHVCTGILVSTQDVLTAEHCFQYVEFNKTEIIVGSSDLRAGIKYYPLWWLTYNEWTSRKNIRREFKENDIAIVRLKTKLPENIRLLTLSTLSTYNLYGLNVETAGWGRLTDDSSPRILATVTLVVLSTPECEHRIEKLLGRRIRVPARVLCTVGKPYALLNCGDSGGPLLHKNTIVGINMSTSPKLVKKIHPGQVNLHLHIDYYRNFIMDVKNNF